jgi:hypothetical protein
MREFKAERNLDSSDIKLPEGNLKQNEETWKKLCQQLK